jgi:hypothetical protein
MNERPKQDDELFELLAREEASGPVEAAPTRLKARTYSALLRRQESSGPLRSLEETRKAGRKLCVFERFWGSLPLGESAKCFNCCSLCHARVLAERLNQPPIYWQQCPYVAFRKK